MASEALMMHIADLIEEGYTSGMCPTWSLNITEEETTEDDNDGT